MLLDLEKKIKIEDQSLILDYVWAGDSCYSDCIPFIFSHVKLSMPDGCGNLTWKIWFSANQLVSLGTLTRLYVQGLKVVSLQFL